MGGERKLPNLLLRQATLADAAMLLEYIDRVATETDFLTFGAGELGVSLEQEKAFIKGALERPNCLLLLAECDGGLVGCLNFSGGPKSRTQHTGEFGITVLQAYWGYGIGRQMIQYLLDWARENGLIKKINLKVRTDNLRALNLYLSLGFKVEGKITREFKIGDVFLDANHMGLELE